MTADRIKEIQDETAFPDSVSVCQALMKVWNECKQERSYSEEEIKNMLIDMSHYISTKELRDNFESEYSEWIRKRDWFINYLFKTI